MGGSGQGTFQWLFIIPGIAALISMASTLLSAILVYRFTHRHSIRSNAERWLDAVRDDISDFVSLHWILCRVQALEGEDKSAGHVNGEDTAQAQPSADAKGRAELVKQNREWEKQRLALLVRLRLRLTKQDEPPHRRLLDATNRLVAARADDEEHQAAQEELLDAACDLVRREWTYIRSGRRTGEPAADYLG